MEGDNKRCIDYAIESATDLAMPIEKRFVLERVAGNIVRPTRSFWSTTVSTPMQMNTERWSSMLVMFGLYILVGWHLMLTFCILFILLSEAMLSGRRSIVRLKVTTLVMFIHRHCAALPLQLNTKITLD